MPSSPKKIRKSRGYAVTTKASRNRAKQTSPSIPPKIFIGIDPGSNSVGYGVIATHQGQIRLLDAGLLASPKRDCHYHAIAEAMKLLLLRWKPSAIGIEKLIFSKNTRTAFAVAEMIGVLKLVMEASNIPWREFTPTAVKMAVSGSGIAPKHIVERMVRAILGLSKEVKSHHAADAIAVALTLERHECRM